MNTEFVRLNKKPIPIDMNKRPLTFRFQNKTYLLSGFQPTHNNIYLNRKNYPEHIHAIENKKAIPLYLESITGKNMLNIYQEKRKRFIRELP